MELQQMIVRKFGEDTRELNMYSWWKNIFERFFALLALVILSPILVLIAIVVRIDSPGNPIFKQERIGKDGRSFNIYKFRTMYKNNDDREYKAFLQRYVLEGFSGEPDGNGQDVLKGEMAIIGPRPDIPFMVAMYQPHHHDRLRVRPGITGLWQVSGRRTLPFEDMVRLDIDYINNQSPLLDAKIALLTVREVLVRDGQ
jgi:lipopolysaccharide/colanic/teichoic acid biosynthesis glycosyltransferase